MFTLTTVSKAPFNLLAVMSQWVAPSPQSSNIKSAVQIFPFCLFLCVTIKARKIRMMSECVVCGIRMISECVVYGIGMISECIPRDNKMISKCVVSVILEWYLKVWSMISEYLNLQSAISQWYQNVQSVIPYHNGIWMCSLWCHNDIWMCGLCENDIRMCSLWYQNDKPHTHYYGKLFIHHLKQFAIHQKQVSHKMWWKLFDACVHLTPL